MELTKEEAIALHLLIQTLLRGCHYLTPEEQEEVLSTVKDKQDIIHLGYDVLEDLDDYVRDNGNK